MKLFIRIGIPCLAVAVALAVGLGLLLTRSHRELRYRTQAALLRSVPVMAADELRARGIRLTAPLACAGMRGASKFRLRVACTGMAQGRRAVQVVAAGQVRTKDQYYTVLVGGRPLVQNAGCLGADCRRKK
ncbi:MAG TPA: hypothetical protein VF069_20770 [Streptosporangiaceae bacterium]